MKTILFVSVALLIFCLVPVNLYSQSSFEGKIVMKVSSQDQEPMNINYYVKGSKIRFEGMSPEQQHGAFIMDTKDQKTLIIMPEQKMYMEFPFKHLMTNAQTNNEDNKDKGDFKITNDTKEINGFNCVKWTYTDEDGSQVEAWMTKALGSFMLFDNPMTLKDMPEWKRKLMSEGYFPMQVVAKNKDGKIDTQMEVTSIEKKSLDESLFTPPSDYKKMEMPMMNQEK